ncbi:MAG: DUF4249 family protein, partial [Bacteroidetes bacterium]|nr:DUF4249 family protein [Bacteroidota bacterium]
MKKVGVISSLRVWVWGCLGAGMLLAACKKAVNIDLQNAPPQLVIEGEIVNGGTPQVKLSRSVKFSDPNSYPPVSGASVRVTDSSNGLVALLVESAPGVYTTKVYS